MLSPIFFNQQINRLNSILSKNAMIVSPEASTYYEVVKETDCNVFARAINILITKWDNSNYRPTPANFLSAIEEAKFGGLSEDEFASVAKTYKVLGIEPPNDKMKALIQAMDKEALSRGAVRFLTKSA